MPKKIDGVDDTKHRWWPPPPFFWTESGGMAYNNRGEQMFRMGCQIENTRSRIFAFLRKEDGSKQQRPQLVTCRSDNPYNYDNINWAYDRSSGHTYYIAEDLMYLSQKVNGVACRVVMLRMVLKIQLCIWKITFLSENLE